MFWLTNPHKRNFPYVTFNSALLHGSSNDCHGASQTRLAAGSTSSSHDAPCPTQRSCLAVANLFGCENIVCENATLKHQHEEFRTLTNANL